MTEVQPLRLLSEPTTGSSYQQASPARVQASAAALRDLADALTAEVDSLSEPIYVRLTLVEHGAFLSPLLYGMNLLPATTSVAPAYSFGSHRRPPATVLRDPNTATADEPFTYAVIANHPVDLQVETVLSAMAQFLARGPLFDRAREHGIDELDRQAAEADAGAQRAVQDALRTRGWSAAADALRSRSIAVRRPLVVNYDPIAFDEVALRRRVPVLRHVYNEMPEARAAIDKMAAALSRSLSTVGGGSRQVAAFVRGLLDVGEHRTYLAHVTRDAFVCGNGYLSFGTARDEDLRLLRPEATRVSGPGRAVVGQGDREVELFPVMHIRGAYQIGSPYGISVLEPFVHLLLQRRSFEDAIDLLRAGEEDGMVSPAVLERQARTAAMAQRVLPTLAEQAGKLLGGVMALPDAPTDLYFPGHERMVPAAEAITLLDEDLP